MPIGHEPCREGPAHAFAAESFRHLWIAMDGILVVVIGELEVARGPINQQRPDGEQQRQSPGEALVIHAAESTLTQLLSFSRGETAPPFPGSRSRISRSAEN